MNLIRVLIRCIFALSLVCCWTASSVRGADAAATPSIPAVLQNGFAAWQRGGGAGMALDAWQKGGLMEGNRKIPAEAAYFKRMDPAIGGYKSFELLQAQPVSQSSQIIYLSINFERAAVYARFLLYKTEQDWVVQNMDFNVKPEAVVPWMALPNGDLNE